LADHPDLSPVHIADYLNASIEAEHP